MTTPKSFLILAASAPLARATGPVAGIDAPRWNVGVLDGELVPVNAMRLSCPRGGDAEASQDVLAVRDRLEMRRVDAVPDTAEVVEVHSIRDRADQQFVDDAMGPMFLALEPDESIPVLVSTSRPLPVPRDPDLRRYARRQVVQYHLSRSLPSTDRIIEGAAAIAAVPLSSLARVVA